MVVFYLLIFALALYGVSFNRNGFNDGFIDKSQCNAIKGVFILFVFLRHVVPYVTKAGYEMPTLLDKAFQIIDGQMGQLIVVMFLFYSGYGVMESIKTKGKAYIDSIPKRRFLTTFINFDIAVSIFLLLDFVLGLQVETQQYFLARFGWDSVGNSNWYIFVILICYLLTYFCFKITNNVGLILATTLVIITVLYFVKPSHWYNTMLCYPVGMLFSEYKNRIEDYCQKNYTKVFILASLIFTILHFSNTKLQSIVYAYTYNIESIFFAAIVLLITMKVSIGNKALSWLGANLFSLYIYQRLTMITLRELAGTEWLAMHPYLYVIVNLFGMIGIAYFYKFWKVAL